MGGRVIASMTSEVIVRRHGQRSAGRCNDAALAGVPAGRISTTLTGNTTVTRSLLAVMLLTLALLLAACGGGVGGSGEGPVTALARADGWRSGIEASVGFLLLEVAHDEGTALRVWTDNVPSELPADEGDPPTASGAYRSLDDVDFARQVVVVVSSGGSSACPPWVRDIRIVGDRVEVHLAREDAQACTDDFQPYRLVLAVDRDRLPDLDALPVERVDVPSDNLTDVEGRMVAYPVATAPEGDGNGIPPTEPDDAFDREAAEARAREFLGLPESEVEEGPMQRIVRRGEEEFRVTMDLQPGRMNLELDDDGTGTYVVTRVTVETPEDEDPLVVE